MEPPARSTPSSSASGRSWTPPMRPSSRRAGSRRSSSRTAGPSITTPRGSRCTGCVWSMRRTSMPEELDPRAQETTGREAEVLAARRASLERLGRERAFAITLEDAIGVREPTPTDAIRRAPPALAPDTLTDDVVTVAGRVLLKRDMGKLVFATLRDRDGDMQVVLQGSQLDAEALALFQEVDLGDIVAVTGRVGTTRKGELSVFAERWAMLTQALRPLPEKWAGLKDPDLQQRRRYLHLIADEEPRRAFRARAAVLKAIRGALDD